MKEVQCNDNRVAVGVTMSDSLSTEWSVCAIIGLEKVRVCYNNKGQSLLAADAIFLCFGSRAVSAWFAYPPPPPPQLPPLSTPLLLFVIHVLHPCFPMNGIKKYLT